ncbi:MAG: magnesium transporter [Planctomycetota bacterium]
MPERNRLLRLLEEAEADPENGMERLHGSLMDRHPADIAFVLEELEEQNSHELFGMLDSTSAANTLVELNEARQKEMIRNMPIGRLGQVVDALPPDDAADIFKLLPTRLRQGILESIDKDQAQQIRLLERYGEETAGGIMTSNFVAVGQDEPLSQAFEKYRQADDLETKDIYVLDDGASLVGVLSIHELLRESNTGQRVADVMDDQVFSVREDVDQEEVWHQASTYGLTTVPVVNAQNRLVGIVTADDIDTVAEEEASEDMFRMAGTLARHPTKQPISRRVFARLPMLLVTVVIGLVISQLVDILMRDEGQRIGHHISSLRFLPIVIALSGNVATIASAIVVRGLATLEIERGRLLQPFFGEFLVGLSVATISAGLTLLGIGLLEGAWFPLGAIVSLALLCSVTISALGGFLIPVISNDLGLDPALTGPFVTALNDLNGTAVYVGICLAIL